MASAVASVGQVEDDLAAAFAGASSGKRGGLGDLRIEIEAAKHALAVANQHAARIAQMGASLDAAS
jgi:hypothetical protein